MILLPKYFSKKPEIQHTFVMLKPNPENYTDKPQEYFREIIEKYIQKSDCILLDEYSKNFTKEDAHWQYKSISFTPYFSHAVDYIMSGDSHLMLISGENSIQKMDNFKDTLRKKFHCYPWLTGWLRNNTPIKNILHASDSKHEARKETRHYFSDFYQNILRENG